MIVRRFEADRAARRLRVLPGVAQRLVHHLYHFGGEPARDADVAPEDDADINTIIFLKLLGVPAQREGELLPGARRLLQPAHVVAQSRDLARRQVEQALYLLAHVA